MLVQPIDRRQTKKLVEENLKIYNRYLLSIADNNQLLINENTFEIRLDVNSENISEKEREKLQFIQYVITRYNRLCILDKKIIYLTYMIKEKNNDGFIANNLGFDLNYYYRIKKEAIINMAYALNIEVYEGDYDEND
jgi:ArpU family phage transcriptional regulator